MKSKRRGIGLTYEEFQQLKDKSNRLSSVLTLPIPMFYPVTFLIVASLAVAIWFTEGGSHAVLISLLPLIVLALWLDQRRYADAVFDTGSSLVVESGNSIEEIPYKNIEDVKWHDGTRMTRVTVHVQKSDQFGKPIRFYKRIDLNPAADHAAAGLLERVQKHNGR